MTYSSVFMTLYRASYLPFEHASKAVAVVITIASIAIDKVLPFFRVSRCIAVLLFLYRLLIMP